MTIERDANNLKSYGELAINNIIYNVIRPNSKVLDLGCGSGLLGALLRKDKNCYVCGVEVDKELKEKASAKLDSVICEDIKNVNLLSFNDKFDYVVCADVLEHTPDPVPVLVAIKNFLNPHGCLLVSMPNVANWRIRIGLLMGNFEYKPFGIMDPGHLRFYTKATARRLLEDSGYTVKKIFSKNSAYKKDFLIRWLGKIWGNLFAYQFVFVAKAEDHRDTETQRSRRKFLFFYLCALCVSVPLWF